MPNGGPIYDLVLRLDLAQKMAADYPLETVIAKLETDKLPVYLMWWVCIHQAKSKIEGSSSYILQL